MAEAQIQLQFEKFQAFIDEYRSKISLGGMFLESEDIRPPGTSISCEFKLTDGFRLCQTQGEVVWVRSRALSADLPAGMAVRFQAIDDQGRELIIKILEEQVKSGGAPFDVDEIPVDADPSSDMAAPRMPSPGEDPASTHRRSAVDPMSLRSEAAPFVGLDPAADETLGGEEPDFGAPWGEDLPEIPSDVLDPVEDFDEPPGMNENLAAELREAGFDADSDLLADDLEEGADEPLPELLSDEPPGEPALSFDDDPLPDSIVSDDAEADLSDLGTNQELDTPAEHPLAAPAVADARGPAIDFVSEPLDEPLDEPSPQVSSDPLFEGDAPSDLDFELGDPDPPLGDSDPTPGEADFQALESLPKASDAVTVGTVPAPDLASIGSTSMVDLGRRDEESDGALGQPGSLSLPEDSDRARQADPWQGESAGEWDEESLEETMSQKVMGNLRMTLAESGGRLMLLGLVLLVMVAGFFFRSELLSLFGEASESAPPGDSSPASALSQSPPQTAPVEDEPEDSKPEGGEAAPREAPPDSSAIETDAPSAVDRLETPSASLPPPGDRGTRQVQADLPKSSPAEGSPTSRPSEPARQILELTHDQIAEGTKITIWMDGVLDLDRVERQELGYDPLKEQLLLRGIVHPFVSQIDVGTLELDRIRTGLHADHLRLVFDLSSEVMSLGSIETRGTRLEVLVRRR